MGACPCCVVTSASVIVGSLEIANQVISLSVDSTQDVSWEQSSNDNCEDLPDDYIYMFGPTKTAVQISAYPFAVGEDYMLGFSCPVSISVSVPWKYVYDCSTCYDCIGENGSTYKRRGGWRGIPMKKRQVTITGDITGSSMFEASGCPAKAVKYTLQAGPQTVVIPQETMQYRRLKFNGLPISFDTDELDDPFTLTVGAGQLCSSIPTFRTATAYLTQFNFTLSPPQPPTVQYSFDLMLGYCPPSC